MNFENNKIILGVIIALFALATIASIGVTYADELQVISDVDNSTLLDVVKSDSGSQTITGIENNAGLQNKAKEVETDDGYYVYSHMENDNEITVRKEGETDKQTVEAGTSLDKGDRVYFNNPVHLRAKYDYTPYKSVVVEVYDCMGNAGKTTTFPKMKRSGDSVSVTFHEPVDYDDENYTFIGIAHYDVDDGMRNIYQPGDTFTVTYDEALPGVNNFIFSYLYANRFVPSDEPVEPDDESIDDEVTPETGDKNGTEDNNNTIDIISNTNPNEDNLPISYADDAANDIVGDIVGDGDGDCVHSIVTTAEPSNTNGNDKGIKNISKPVPLPETGTKFALLLVALLGLLVMTLAGLRRG